MNKTDFFDNVAAGGAPLLFTNEDRKKILRLRKRLGDLSGLRILEPGCGAGPLTEYLSEWVGPNGHILAFDVSPKMVEECRRRLIGRTNVEIVCAAAEIMPIGRARWDMVMLFRVFPHFDDKELVLRRFREYLVPSGRLVIAHLEGSQRLNARHARFSEPVRHDRMPAADTLRDLLKKTGYAVRAIIDVDDEFYAEAIPA